MKPDITAEANWETWRNAWQAEGAGGQLGTASLRTKVERQNRWMRQVRVVQILLTVVIGGGTTVWALRWPQPDLILLAAVTWLLWAVAWTVALTINHRTGSAAEIMETTAYLDLLIRRCHGRLASINFGAGLFAVLMAFCLEWIHLHPPPSGSSGLDGAGVASVAFYGSLLWYRQKKRAELAALRRVRDDFTGFA